MKRNKGYTVGLLSLELLMIVIAILFLIPFYFVIANAGKDYAGILLNASSFPGHYLWSNFTKAWEVLHFPNAIWNSFLITVFSNIGLVVISSMAAYYMVRRPNRFTRLLFLLFTASMVVPFQSVMIPLVQTVKTVGLMDSIPGLVICYFGFGVSISTFLYHGFMKSIPLEIEEAAIVDGCSVYGVFWKIVFPLLKPMTVTIILLNTLWIWNDFLLPLLILQDESLRTIPLATYSLFGQFTKQWDLALAALILGVAPIVAFFLALQRHIVEGIAAGSVKG